MPISFDPNLPKGINILGDPIAPCDGQNTVVWSPNGSCFATGGEDGSLRLWNQMGNLITTLWGHYDAIWSVAWSPDGKRLASASADKTVRLWDAESTQLLYTLQAHSKRVSSVAWSPDGKRLASASADGTVCLWDTDSTQLLHTLRGHSERILSVAWSPDGKRLASASDDSTVRLWDTDSAQLLHTLREHINWVMSVAWSPDGKYLASASVDKTVRLWNANSTQLLHTLRGHSDSVWGVAWSLDSKQLASASVDKTVCLWDTDSAQLLHTLQGHVKRVWSVAWSPDGKRLASASADKTVRLWDAESTQLLYTLQAHSKRVSSVAWSPDGKRLASASADGTVCLWDTDSTQLLHTLRGHNDSVLSVVWSPDGKRLASASDSIVRLWDTDSAQLLHTLRRHGEGIWSVAWSPDGKRLASTSDSIVRLWDTDSAQLLHTLRGHSERILSMAWSPDGKYLASASVDKTVCLWDTDSTQLLHTLRGHNDSVLSVVWSPDGKCLASASDSTVRLWNISSPARPNTLRGHNDSVLSVAWSPDGKRLASASADKTVRLWDAESTQLLHTLQGHSNWVTSVEWSLDSEWVLSSSDNATLLWRAVIETQIEQTVELPRFTHAVFAPQSLAIAGVRQNYAPQWLSCDATILSGVSGNTVYYNNAKIVLVGDSGVGKTGLSLVLCSKSFEESRESTHGRKVHLFHNYEEHLDGGNRETREILLWDLAGQPGYRLIHQLHLHEVAVALVVFDARDEKDPLSSVLYWNRALEQSRRWQSDKAPKFVKILVSARVDRGTVAVSRGRIDKLIKDEGFASYFETSAKEGGQIIELRDATLNAIDWAKMEAGASTLIFHRIKEFLLKRQQAGLVLANVKELLVAFQESWTADDGILPTDLNLKFGACISLLEKRDLLRHFTYGDLVLLQPELLDAYASSIIEEAKREPDGFGCLPARKALSGAFDMTQRERLTDRAQEKLLLPAVVEDFLLHDLATTDKDLLVFPSQVTKQKADYPDPVGKAVIFSCEGPLNNIYATLAVRLARSGQFRKSDLWQNAATFNAVVGGECGFYMKTLEEGHGEIGLFFNQAANEQTRYTFEDFVASHLDQYANPGTVKRRRIFQCIECGQPIPDSASQRRRERGFNWAPCGVCETHVSLHDGLERLQAGKADIQKTAQTVKVMNETANDAKQAEGMIASAVGESRTPEFHRWLGTDLAKDELVHFVIVFTDLVNSTDFGEKIGNIAMSKIQDRHFAHVRRHLQHHSGYEIATAGDSFLTIFKTSQPALDFALILRRDSGVPDLSVRIAIHSGEVILKKEGGIFSNEISYADRIIKQAKGVELWVSTDVYRSIQGNKFPQTNNLKWKSSRHILKGFEDLGEQVLWSLLD